MDVVELPPNRYEFMTRPLVEAWMGLLRRAGDAKKEFNDRAEMCESFYKKDSGFVWKADFKSKFIGPEVPVPKYNVTVNTAFEYVSRFGPRLYWQNPRRRVTRPAKPELDLEALAGGDLFAAMQMQQAAIQQRQFDARTAQSNNLWETYLNYTPAEMPGGGLEAHARLAIDEALVTGRGVLMARSYLPPEGQRRLTGCFHVPNCDLLIDPDCRSPLLVDCKWIAVRHVTPYWELERRFGWPKNSLRNKGHYESGESQGTRPKQKPFEKDSEVPCDLVEWYEIWSKTGIGARFVGTKLQNKDVWDEICGEYCYLAITDKVKSPLNMPAWWLAGDVDEEQLREAVQWPVPLWKDGRWPVSLLDFYNDFSGPWPLAPLAAAIGEMICLQILLALYLQNAESNSQQIIAYLDSAAQQIEDQIKSGKSPAFIKIIDGAQKSIKDLVEFLNRPNMNTDILQAMEFLMGMIERKTGLSALLYGENPGGTQDRSAAATQTKATNVTLIPDFMAKQVAAWQGDAADKERLTAFYAGVSGDDVAPLLGPLGAYAWDQLVANEDEETVLRGMRARVEASDMRKPDKQRDADNLNQLAGYMVPALMQYGQMTGDFSAWSGFIQSIADAMELDTDGWMIESGPPPQGQQDEAKMAMEQQKAALDQQNAEADMQRKAQESEMKLAAQQQQMAMKQQQSEADMQMRSAEHQQKLSQGAQIMWQRMAATQAQNALKLQQQRASMNGSKQ